MRGYLYFEKQNWQDALNQFVEARTIYESFAKYGNNAEAEALCFSAIDEIDPNIRFCSYKLQPGASQDIESIVGNLKSNSAEMQKLESQLSSEELVKNQSQSVQAISWRQKEITIKQQTVSEAVLKAQEVTKKAAGKEGDVAGTFNTILAAWADAEKKAKKALKDDKEATAKVSSSKSALATQNLETLFTFVEYNLYAASIERNLRLAKKIEESNGKVQQVIKLYDDSLKDLEYLADLPKIREDMSLEGELHSVTLYYKAYR
jgi:signal recognition particle subunit SRP68